jgi:alcohol dehydrogenase YqhD (iron-dependent ADH family)
MKDFVFRNPTKIIFGMNSMDQINENIRVFGHKVLVTYGKGSIKDNGIYDKVMRQLEGLDVREFSGIEPNPRVETVRKAVNEFRDFNPDIILAVGGGSVVDGSKLIAASLHYNGDPWDFLVDDKAEPTKYVPLAVVLTLAATGSEMNSGAVITKWETNEKPFFVRDELYPKFSILDPQNTFTVPKDQTAYGVVDAFSHVLEQYIHTAKDVPLQDRISEGILLTLIENGLCAVNEPENYNARANVMLCATMALNDILTMGTGSEWAVHALEHEFSAFYDIPHGAGLAIITPRWMSEVKDYKIEKLCQYGKRVFNLDGDMNSVAEQAITKTFEFFESLGVKMNFSSWNINDKHFEEMTDRLVKMKVGERPLDRQTIQKILTDCL